MDSESIGEKRVGSFYGAPVNIVTRHRRRTDGSVYTIYSADIGVADASMPMFKHGEGAPIGEEQGLQQLKSTLSRALNPVSENRPVPRLVATAEDLLFDINERLKAATSGAERSKNSLAEAQAPIDSLEKRLQMLHDSFMADSSGAPQPEPDFIENLDSYMKEGEGEDEESALYKVDGGAVLRDGAYDPAKHMKSPEKKDGGENPTPPDGGGTRGTSAGQDESGDALSNVHFESADFAPGAHGIANADQDEALTERGLKAPAKRARGDEKVMEGAEKLISNADFMRKLEHVVARAPRSLSAEENVAMAQDFLKVKDEYDDLVHSISEAMNAGDESAVKQMEGRKTALERRMTEIVKAREGGVGEAARTLRTNRFLFDNDYSYAGLVAKRMADLGRPLTDVKFKELKDIADALKKLDEEDRDRILARIKAFADKAIRDFIAQAKVDSASTPRGANEFRKMLRKRNEALAQIEVLAYELGGDLNAIIPTGDEEDFAGSMNNQAGGGKREKAGQRLD